MKRKLLLIICSLLVASSSAQNISFADPQFKSYLLQANATNDIAKNLSDTYFKIDSNNDGEISIAEAQSVGKLYLNNLSIHSINEIVSFANLSELTNGTASTNIDLGNMPNLTKYFGNSNNYTASLNFQNCTNLKEINCLWVYNLASLNLQGCVNLFYLGATHTQINSLNLEGLPNLQYVDLQINNNLTQLDFSYQTNLKNIALDLCNSLNFLIIKNGSTELVTFDQCPSLETICADASQIPSLQNSANNYGYSSININSNCAATTLNTPDAQKSKNRVTIYPNPTNDFLNISTTNKYEIIGIQILDASGKMLKELKASESKIDVKNLKAGVYFVKFQLLNNNDEVQKFIKQ